MHVVRKGSGEWGGVEGGRGPAGGGKGMWEALREREHV